MKIDYACVFGISDAVTFIRPGEQLTTFNNGRSIVSFPGKNGQLFWFLLKKLEHQYTFPATPRWSQKDAEELAQTYANDQIRNGFLFSEVWSRRQLVGITNLEENVFSTWHWDRIVCIGDSMHKVRNITPTQG